MEVKEILKIICEEDGLDNISFNEKTFTIYFGDILNTNSKTGLQYYLLDTYVEIPYSFEPGRFLLHRGIINEYEWNGTNDFDSYSGFVHYNPNSTKLFCYGESGVDTLAQIMRDPDELTSDNFNMFLLKFHTYLSVSSHETMGNYRTYEAGTLEEGKWYVDKWSKINDSFIPVMLVKNSVIKTKIADYTKPYYEIIRDFPERKFTYNGEEKIPIIVKHHTTETQTVKKDVRYVDYKDLMKIYEKEIIQKLIDEVNNKPKITFETLLHKLSNKQHRVDGRVYI